MNIDAFWLWWDARTAWISSDWIDLILSIWVLIAVGVGLQLLIRVLLRRLRRYLGRTGTGGSVDRRARAKTITAVVNSSLSAVLWLVIILMILDRLGVTIAPLIASAGVAGLAISFGSQEIIRDAFAGFFFLLENQFNVGSEVQIRDKRGVVVKMDLRTVTLRSEHDHAIYIFRNSQADVITKFDPELTEAPAAQPQKTKKGA